MDLVLPHTNQGTLLILKSRQFALYISSTSFLSIHSKFQSLGFSSRLSSKTVCPPPTVLWALVISEAHSHLLLSHPQVQISNLIQNPTGLYLFLQ